jgi:hypothetical protein
MHVPSIQLVVVLAKSQPLSSHFEKRIEQNIANFALLLFSHGAHSEKVRGDHNLQLLPKLFIKCSIAGSKCWSA